MLLKQVLNFLLMSHDRVTLDRFQESITQVIMKSQFLSFHVKMISKKAIPFSLTLTI